MAFNKNTLVSVLKVMLSKLEGETEIKMAAEMMFIDGNHLVTPSDTFESGVPVFVKDKDTLQTTPLVAGEYELTDGKRVVVVADGILDSIIDAATEEVISEPVIETPAEPIEEVVEELEVEDPITKVMAKLSEMESKIQTLMGEKKGDDELLTQLSAVIEKLSEPAVESITKLSSQEKRELRAVDKYRQAKGK